MSLEGTKEALLMKRFNNTLSIPTISVTHDKEELVDKEEENTLSGIIFS